MRFWPSSLLWRTVLTAVVLLFLSQAVLLGVSSHRQRDAVRDSRSYQAAEQIATVVRALDNTPFASRETVLTGLSGPGFRALVTDQPLLRRETADRRFRPLYNLVLDVLGAPARPDIVVRHSLQVPWEENSTSMVDMHRQMNQFYGGKAGMGPSMGMGGGMHHPHAVRLAQAWGHGSMLVASVPLAGGGWLNAAVPLDVGESFWTAINLRPFFVIGVLFSAVAVWAAWRAVQPLDVFARAAERLGRDVHAPPLDVKGPAEMRRAAKAFNRMQQSLRGFVADRTQMLAAVSHDLRTPITRLRLRAELMDDEELRAKTLADLDDMEAMITTTLAFARDDAVTEPVQAVDLAALLQTVCDDAADAGSDVAFEGPAHRVFEGRALALKRAFVNLVGNAVAYGGAARVTLAETTDRLVITVDDDGPGLAEGDLDAVFKPYYRAEKSRSRDTGGTGLGLAVVRAAITAHGGTVTLENRDEGGLRARVVLPVAAGA